MEEYGFFWNSKNGDRRYSADSFEKWLKKFFTTGVFEGDLQVTATSGMGISVAEGYCNINGKVMVYEPKEFTLEAAYPSNDRIDAVVIERNETNRAITMKVVKGGTDGATPLPERDADTYQLIIAYISVAAGAVSISQMNITDTRMNSTLCGYVASTVNEIDFSQIAAQFNDWFFHFRSELDGDIAGNLQGEIDVLDDYKENAGTMVSVTLSANGWVQDIDESYYYSFENTYPSAEYDISDVIPIRTTTNAMRSAWIAADCGGYEETNVVRCHGYKPDIDIVVGLVVKRKGGLLS